MIYTNRIKEAIYFASQAHKNQKRKVLDYPYISHPLSVLFIVSHYTSDEDVLLSCVLHDTVEDTDASLDDIELNFGKKVRDIVDVLSEDNTMSDKEEMKRIQLERFKSASHEALLIKLADIIVNFCDISLVLANYPKELYLEVFGSNIEEKIIGNKERLDVIENAWPENPLLPEAKERFLDYKKAVESIY